MSVMQVIKAPDPILKKKSEYVEGINEEIRKLASDMIDTMYAEGGIGLAAVQVGILKKVIVVDVNWEGENKNPVVLINAEIIQSSENISTYKEGCLSFPGQYSDVKRPESVQVRYRDLDWNEHIIEVSGLFATCIQHEIDHTNGITFVDHISKVKRDIILMKLKKATRS